MADTSRASAPPIDAGASGLTTTRSFSLSHVHTSEVARDVVVVSAVAFVLGLIRLGTPSLWLDESFSASGDPVTAFTGGYHWLYYSLEKPWTSLAGTSEWALRFPSVVGAMLACGLLVVLANRLFERSVALLSGLFLATSPFFVKWSQQARGYTLLVAVSLLATLLLLRALERGTRAAWALYGLAFTVVVVWHPVGALLLAPAQAVLIAQRRERARPHGLLAAAIIVALGVPWAAQIALRSTGEGVAMNWLTFPTAHTALWALLDVSGAAGLGVLLSAIGLWALRRARKNDVAIWLATWAFAPFLVALLVSTVRPIYLDRYLIVAAPAFALLAGVAVMGIARRYRAVLAAVIVVATSAGLVYWYSLADRGNWRGEDWRSAVATVLQRRGDADAIVVAPWSAGPAAAYYGARVSSVSSADSIWVLTWSEKGRDLSAAEREAIGLGDHVRVEKLQFGWRLTAQLWKRK
jgi:mannosyltransferase